MTDWADILSFWFEDISPNLWYMGGPGFDATIRARFENTSLNIAAHLRKDFHHDWLETKDAMLALILVLDQFPRNMYRDTKAAFAFDDLALQCTNLALERGFDLKTQMDRRAFFYMPLMHSENLADQDRCVALMDARLKNESSLFHAKQHRAIIEKFGRFPHRNALLGRKTTPDEHTYLNSKAYRP